MEEASTRCVEVGYVKSTRGKSATRKQGQRWTSHEPPTGKIRRKTSVPPASIEEIIARRVAIPAAEGNYQAAFSQLKQIMEDIHLEHSKDMNNEPIADWIQESPLLHSLHRDGVITMGDFLKQTPEAWSLKLGFSRKVVTRIARIQNRFIKKQHEAERLESRAATQKFQALESGEYNAEF